MILWLIMLTQNFFTHSTGKNFILTFIINVDLQRTLSLNTVYTLHMIRKYVRYKPH